MNESYQDKKEQEISEPTETNFATIGAIFTDGVTLIFDGEKTATEKHYKVNTSAKFAAGNRVKICKDSGTYIVEYAVGAPSAGGSDASTLNGKTEEELSVYYAVNATNAGTLNNHNESDLDVKRATAVYNHNTPYYDIYFQHTGSAFYVKYGLYGRWQQIKFV
ncbi:MAG: hypothetical protein RR365_11045 [Bacteroides sp.]